LWWGFYINIKRLMRSKTLNTKFMVNLTLVNKLPWMMLPVAREIGLVACDTYGYGNLDTRSIQLSSYGPNVWGSRTLIKILFAFSTLSCVNMIFSTRIGAYISHTLFSRSFFIFQPFRRHNYTFFTLWLPILSLSHFFVVHHDMAFISVLKFILLPWFINNLLDE